MQEIIWSKDRHCLWPVYHGDDRLLTCSQEPEKKCYSICVWCNFPKHWRIYPVSRHLFTCFSLGKEIKLQNPQLHEQKRSDTNACITACPLKRNNFFFFLSPLENHKTCWCSFASSLLSMSLLFFLPDSSNLSGNKRFYLDLRHWAGLSTRPRSTSRDCRMRSRYCFSKGIRVRGSLRGGCTGPERACSGSPRRCHMPFTSTAQLNLIICLIIRGRS